MLRTPPRAIDSPERASESREPEPAGRVRELGSAALAALREGPGYWLCRREASVPVDSARECFLHLLDSLGENVSRDAVGNPVRAAVIRSNPDPSFDGAYVGDAHTSNEIPLHVDGSGEDDRHVRILGMFCEHQSGLGGETLLCDPVSVLSSLSPEELALLREPWPRRRPHGAASSRAYSEKAILADGESGPPGFCYGFQRLLLGLEAIGDPAERSRRRALLGRLDSMLKANARELRLEDGDFILIDNQRILHGRRAFVDSPESPRSILRVWIGERTSPAPEP